MPVQLDSRRLRYAEYFKWRDGDYDSVFAVTPTQANGLGYFETAEDKKVFNAFAVASQFYEDALGGGANTELAEKLVRHWAVTGEFCVVRAGGVQSAVRPDFVFPQFSEDDDTNIIRYYFVYPKIEQNGVRTGRARVVEYIVGREAVQYETSFTDGHLGDRPSDVSSVSVDSVVWRNTRDGFYASLEPLTRELNIRMLMTSSGQNADSYPLLMANRQSVTTKGSPDLANARNSRKTGIGHLVDPPFSNEAAPGFIQREGQSVENGIQLTKLLIDKISIVTGVPGHQFDLRSNQSSADSERVVLNARSKIRRATKALVEAEVGFSAQDPFTRSQFSPQDYVAFMQAGVYTPQEVRNIFDA